MQVSDPNPAPQLSERTGTLSGHNMHLLELVRSLRTLAAESPEREAYIERIAQAYARGTYRVDPSATAGRIIDEALGRR